MPVNRNIIFWGQVTFFCYLLFSVPTTSAQQSHLWSPQKALIWYQKQPWIVGCNFIPSTAVNEIEMWQAESFDSATIGRELGLAAGIGMNAVRVFLHYIPWKEDAEGFKFRVETFLALADRNHIKTIFVFFDDCWNGDPHPGIQPSPRPGVHNSGWVQCPGTKMHADSSSWKELGSYEKDFLTRFKDDGRILCWDLYNEPGNSDYHEKSLSLLKRIFEWAWEIRPSQPLTCGIWTDEPALNAFQLTSSDIISFHNYDDSVSLEKQIKGLTGINRPLLCTEYMARTHGSRFTSHLPVFLKYNVGAINWGLVSGKTNTIFPWGSKEGGPEPAVWFHDIFRKDGTPFDPMETAFIKTITKR